VDAATVIAGSRRSTNVEGQADDGSMADYLAGMGQYYAQHFKNNVGKIRDFVTGTPAQAAPAAAPMPLKTNDPLAAQAGYNSIAQTPDPRDFTGKYNTPLAPDQEQAFQNWTQQQSQATGRNVGNDTYDYDLRGWYAQNGAQPLTGAHLTDQFKKPNHPTFSDQSQYSGNTDLMPHGGTWDKQPDGSFAFTPGDNVYSTPELQDYFNKVEPDNSLNLPPT
jgi:hypothetical protein